MRPIGIVCVVVFFLQVLPLRAELRVGVGATDITAPRGIPMAGYYHVRLNEGGHQERHQRVFLVS